MKAGVDWEWATGWPASESLALPDQLLRLKDAPWVAWPGTGLEGRDLGLERLSRGQLGAQHVRATGEEARDGEWHCYDLDLEFLHVLVGTLVLQTRDGTEHPLGPGSSLLHPPFFWHRDIYRSGDLEVVRITSAAQGDRFDGLRADLPPRAATLPNGRAAEYVDPPGVTTAPHLTGDAVRDLNTGPLTGGRVRVQVRSWAEDGTIRRLDAAVGVWVYVIAGVAELAGPSGARVTLRPGDALSSDAPAGSDWRFLRSSPGFASLELRLGTASGG